MVRLVRIPTSKPITCRRCSKAVKAKDAAARGWTAVDGAPLCPDCQTARAASEHLDALDSATTQLHRGMRARPGRSVKSR